jgi:Flp pilus assembly protein TadG
VTRLRGDAGQTAGPELMLLLVFALGVMVLLGYLGRLNSTGTNLTNVAQDAARAASQQPDPVAARTAARDAVRRSTLSVPCQGSVAPQLSWQPSMSGAWYGGSVTVRLSCTVRNRELSGAWVPGARTISVADTQVIDAYQGDNS